MSLEGLSSLIQLESTRLEGFKQTTQNIQQVNGAVQQIGVQVAQNKISVWKDRIGTECDKEIQQAAVKKAESKLARERKAESMAAMIVQGVTILSAASNVWNAASDLMGKQKLGDIPDYLKTTPIDPKSPNSMAFSTPQNANGNSSVYAIGKNEDGSETVLSMQRDRNNGMTSPKAATVSFYDINSILGSDNDFARLKTDLAKIGSFADAKKAFPNITEENFNRFKANGDVSFSLLAQTSPDLAAKVMQDKGHGMSRDESKNFVETLDKRMPTSSTTLEGATPTSSSTTPAASTDAQKLARIRELTALQADLELAGSDEKKLKAVKDKYPNINIDGKSLSSIEARDMLAKVKEEIAKPENATPPKTDSPTVAPDRYTSLTGNPIPTNYSFNVSKKDDGSSDVTLYDKDKKTTVTVNFPKGEPKGHKSFEALFKEKGSEALGVFMNKVNEPTTTPTLISGNAADQDMVTKKADGVTHKAAISALQGTGHLSKDYDSNIAMKGVKGLMGAGKLLTDCVVNTAKDAAPYFQAYLEAKTRADQAQDELTEALTKLAALTKKLKAIQMQLDLFNGKGA